MTQMPTLFDNVTAKNERAPENDHGEDPSQTKLIRHVGHIPKSWDVKKMGELLRSLDAGYSASGEDRPASGEEKGVLKVSAVSYEIFRSSENKRVPPENQDDLKTSPREGDLVISRSNTVVGP